ncbi:hypothetical protein H4R21_005829, partial [Coemansia helicoidea]
RDALTKKGDARDKELARTKDKVTKLEQANERLEKRRELEASMRAEAEAALLQHRPTQPEVERAFAQKCLVAQPKGKLSYAAIVRRMDAAPSGVDRANIKSGYWPEDDTTTMVVTGLAGRIGKCRDDLICGGLPREAVINIEPLHSAYSIVTVATSLQDKVLQTLDRLPIEIVEPAEAAVARIPSISEEGKAELSKRIALRLDNRLAANFVQQRFTAGQQLREMATKLMLPIKSREEVEALAKSGKWRKRRWKPWDKAHLSHEGPDP